MKRSDFVDNNMVFRILSDHAGWVATDCVNLHDVIQERDTDYHWTVTAVSPTQITVVRRSQSFVFPIYKDGSSVTSSPDVTPTTTTPSLLIREHVNMVCSLLGEMHEWDVDNKTLDAFQAHYLKIVLDKVLDLLEKQ